MTATYTEPGREWPTNNTAFLRGIVGQDPEMKFFESGNKKIEFSISVSNGKNADGTYKESDWWKVEGWGDIAESLSNAVSKKTRIAVRGKLALEKWVDKQTGKNVSRPKLIINDYTIEESNGNSSGGTQQKAITGLPSDALKKLNTQLEGTHGDPDFIDGVVSMFSLKYKAHKEEIEAVAQKFKAEFASVDDVSELF